VGPTAGGTRQRSTPDPHAVRVVLAALRLRESHAGRPRFDLLGVPLAAAGFLGLTWGPIQVSDRG
jgi:hypothetical protein